MGSSQSSTVKVLNQSMTQNLNNIVRSNINQSTAVQINRNTAKITADRIICPQISNTQTIDATQAVYAIQKINNSTELISKINEAMDATARNKQEATNGFLATTFGSQKSKTEAINIMKSLVQNNINEESVNQVNAVIDNANKYEIDIDEIICGRDGKIENNQSIVTNQVAQAMQDVFSAAIAKNETVRKAIGKSTGEQKYESKGADSLFGPMFFMIAIIIIAFIVGGIFLFKSLLSSPEAMDIVKSKVGGPKPF